MPGALTTSTDFSSLEEVTRFSTCTPIRTAIIPYSHLVTSSRLRSSPSRLINVNTNLTYSLPSAAETAIFSVSIAKATPPSNYLITLLFPL